MKFPDLTSRLLQALKEDGAFSDVTSSLLAGLSQTRTRAKIIAKAQGVFCGGALLRPLFSLMDRGGQVQLHRKDGALVRPGQAVASIHATPKALFGCERVSLNLCCHLSGIATLTRSYVAETRGTNCVIMDTRKTTPLWRDVEKYAVRCGGGKNHRNSLAEAILVKDNHLQVLRNHRTTLFSLLGKQATARIKKSEFFEIEAQSLDDVWQAIKCRTDIVLLDNMPLERLKQAITLIKAARSALDSSYPLIEVSGGISLSRVKPLAKLGVDRISVGALTHSAPVLDLSMEVINGRF